MTLIASLLRQVEIFEVMEVQIRVALLSRRAVAVPRELR